MRRNIMDNRIVREELKKYLKENHLTQKSFANLIKTSESKLSNYITGKSGDYSWLEPTIRRFLEQERNNLSCGMKITDSIKENIIKVLQIILADTNKKTFLIKEYDNWNTDYITNYFSSLNVQIDIKNYNKSGLYTDTDCSVVIDINVQENANYLILENELKKLIN